MNEAKVRKIVSLHQLYLTDANLTRVFLVDAKGAYTRCT
jgi:hypothetical protein